MQQAVGTLLHLLQVRVDQFDPVHHGDHVGVLAKGADADGAVLADLHLFLRRHGDRPTVAEHRQAVAGAQHAEGVDMHAGGTHVGLAAIRRLDRDEAVAVDGDVQLVAGFLEAAMAEIGTGPLAHGEYPRREAVAEHLHRTRLLEVATKAAGRDVRQVVGMSTHRQGVLAGPAHGDVQHLVHRILQAPAQSAGLSCRLSSKRRARIRKNN